MQYSVFLGRIIFLIYNFIACFELIIFDELKSLACTMLIHVFAEISGTRDKMQLAASVSLFFPYKL